MPPEPDAASRGPRRFVLLGDPVSHSLSPRIHNAAFRELGLDAVYSALRCERKAVAEHMRSVAGGNVTVPHKRVAAESIDRSSNAVRATGACNTFWLERGTLRGDNTDVAGFDRALRELVGHPKDANVLLIGAGGAAAAALYALLSAGVAHVTVQNRTPRRAKEMVTRVAPHDERVRLSADGVLHPSYDLAVNATTLGLRPDDAMPLELESTRVDAVFDMVYSPNETPWVRAARAAGIPATDGKAMLLYQAAAAFERWWDRSAPLDAMRAALESA